MKKQVRKIVEHAQVSEKSIERYLERRVSMRGGLCLKYSSMIATGYPDRVCLLPDGRTFWVEVKSEDGQLSLLQEHRIRKMRELGHEVHVCRSLQEIDWIFAE